MEVKAQTVEQFLYEQLEKVAPGKYSVAGVLEQFKSKLRFSCSHLKGGRTQRYGIRQKDYNISIFTFPTGVTEIKCLYNCGLKIRSDEKDLVSAFNELYDLPSTNTKAQSERFSSKPNPGPVPTYSNEYRQRIKDSTEMFWKSIEQGLANGRIKPNDPVLGALLPHPDPIEAPDSIIERSLVKSYANRRNTRVLQAVATAHDRIPAPQPVKKIKRRKATQSRKRGK